MFVLGLNCSCISDLCNYISHYVACNKLGNTVSHLLITAKLMHIFLPGGVNWFSSVSLKTSRYFRLLGTGLLDQAKVLLLSL